MNYKRIFDVIASLVIMVLLFIPAILICLIVYIQTRQSPFFIQERGLTLSLYRFKIYKFRTIIGNELLANNNSYLNRDINVDKHFSFGKFLRRTGLDELPQILNILKGEMTFVGPRPLDLSDLKQIKNNHSNLYKIRKKTNIKPGLTGYWQITRDEIRSVIYLVKADLYYKENKSFSLDLKIITYSIIFRMMYNFFFNENYKIGNNFLID